MVYLKIPLLALLTTLTAHKRVASAHTSGSLSLLATNSFGKRLTRTVSWCSMASQASSVPTGYLTATEAQALDQELMQTPGYTLEQLMELAGLSVAEAVVQVVPSCKILLICGPGNNGGDGLVAARHLVFFGYEAVVLYPKRSSREPHYANLVKQCEDMGIVILDDLPKDLSIYCAMVDAIFGFSFQGAPREPFNTILETMMDAQSRHKIPIISVDVPSGWHVDDGDVSGTGFIPDVLVSLTAPKNSSKLFQGRHFCGGRFLPPMLASKYNLQMPNYQGVSQVVELTGVESWEQKYDQILGKQKCITSRLLQEHKSDSWEVGYALYCEAKERESSQQDDAVNVNEQCSWQDSTNPPSWEAEYAVYCAEKENTLKDS